nr:regulator [Microcella frigidaquae]
MRAGHAIAWRAADQDDVLTQLAQRAPDVLLVADHPAVATSGVVGAADLLGVRTCLIALAGADLSPGAARLGVLDVLPLGAEGLDLGMLDAGRAPAPAPLPLSAEAPTPAAVPTSATAPAQPAAPALDPGLVPAAAPPAAAPPRVAEHSRAEASTPFVRRPRTIVVWGPAGAPGRTTLAIGLAAELAGRGHAVALIDADTYGGTIAPALGLLDEAPGFAAACRLAGAEALTIAELDRIAQPSPAANGADMVVLTGIGRPHRWPELSAGRVASVLERCRRWREVIVVDAGFNLEADEELSSDLAAPRRNAATIAALRAADEVVAVGSADPVGLARLLRAHGDLVEAAEAARVRVVVNRVRASVLGIDPHGQVRQTLERFVGVRDAVLIENDPDAADLALLTARPVTVAAPRGALGRGIAELADALGFARSPALRTGARWAARLGARRGAPHPAASQSPALHSAAPTARPG